jgi:hypothetical protein
MRRSNLGRSMSELGHEWHIGIGLSQSRGLRIRWATRAITGMGQPKTRTMPGVVRINMYPFGSCSVTLQ